MDLLTSAKRWPRGEGETLRTVIVRRTEPRDVARAPAPGAHSELTDSIHSFTNAKPKMQKFLV